VKLGSFCTGYGGLEIGLAQILDFDIAWHCENDPHASNVLEVRFPGVPNLGDLTKVDWEELNNDPANLECLPKDEHARRYGTGCNQYAHHCGKEVLPSDSPAVDIITAGYP
jgi:site-specific DNA-cytosine methylase